MAVSLTINNAIDPTGSFNDSLAGGGTGIDLGSVQNGQYAPLADQPSNTGALDIYIVHDAVDDPITDVKTFIQEYGTSTSFTYGGRTPGSPSIDYNAIVALGNASGSVKNNDGSSGGLWIDMDADSSTTNQFDHATFPALVKIYGDNNTDGIDLASAFGLVTDAMVYDAPGETAASAPVAGQIGKSGDTALGDNAHIKMRVYLPDSQSDGGIFQVEWAIAYSFTS